LLSEESYLVFSQAVRIQEIYQKKSPPVTKTIDNFKKILPEFFVLKSLDFDNNKKEIKVVGGVPSWLDYVRLLAYLSHHQDINLKSFSSPRVSEKKLIEFDLVISLKPNFYQ